ncbi:MAG: tetratricopeptide repeat protein [Deltaproteobacteria bacterium]|nr:tetratricopeptide repeat protein [Deltaproteobacteria bacterium]
MPPLPDDAFTGPNAPSTPAPRRGPPPPPPPRSKTAELRSPPGTPPPSSGDEEPLPRARSTELRVSPPQSTPSPAARAEDPTLQRSKTRSRPLPAVPTPVDEPPREGARGARAVLPEVLDSEEDILLVTAELGPGIPSEPSQPGQLGLVGDVDVLFTSVHGFMEQELDHLDPQDKRGRAVLLYELGHLEETVFRDVGRAEGRYREAFELDRGFVPALRALRRRHEARSRWRDALQVLEAEVEATPREELRAALLTQQAELLASRLSDTEGALKALQAAVALSPRSRRAVEALRGIYSRLERWEELLEALRQIANITSEEAERARLTVEMAELSEFRLGRAKEAEELYAHALVLDPASQKAAMALRRLYLAHGRWKELSELLAKEAGREHEPEEMFADLYRSARISETHLHDDVRAASLLETAAALKPADPLPLQSLAETYERMGRHEEQAAAIGRQLRLVRDPADRATLCYRLGRTLQHWLGRTDQAMDAYREALKHQPGHEATIRALVALYQQAERWEELLELELLRAERVADNGRRADGYLKAAALCEQRLKDVPRAVELYDRAWRLLPGTPDAFRALDRIYRQSERWQPLAELYEAKAELTQDPPLMVSLLRGAAAIYEEKLRLRDRAIVTLERLRERRPGDRETLVYLARLYEEAGRVEQLRQALEEWAAVTEDERERTELRRRIGELYEGPLRRPEQAVEVYRQILETAPGDRATLERLKASYERTGRWNDLVQILRAEIAVVGSEELAPLQLEIGQLCEDKLGDLDQAGAAYDAALAADAGYTPAMLAQEELLRRQGAWGRLVALLVAQAERLKEPARAAASLCRAGEVCEEQLKEQSQAEQHYHRALELDPGNTPARHGLERLYLAAQDRRALEAHYIREAEGASNPVVRVRAYLRLAALFEGPGDDATGAMAAYESALKAGEDQPEALHSLAALCRRRGNWVRLAALLARVAGSAHDRDAALAALKEWASLVELHLADRWDPAPIYERVLDGDAQDYHGLNALERLGYNRGDFKALLPLTLRQIRAGGDLNWVTALCVRAATFILAGGKYREAAEILRRGLEGTPTYLPAIRLLRRIDEVLEEWGEAAQLLLTEGDLAANPEASRSALARAGNLLLDRFGDVEGARAAFERVFAGDPANAQAFGRLAQILSDAADYPALVDLYRRRLEAVESSARAPLQLQLAALYRDSLRDEEAAVEVLRVLLAADPEHRAALAEISELCASQHRWREAEQYLEQLARLGSEQPEARRDAQLRRSAILEERLGDEEGALSVLEELVQEFPGDGEVLRRCILIYQRRGDWGRTVEVLGELARTGPAGERVSRLVDLAEIYSRTLGDRDSAHQCLRRAGGLLVETGAGIDRVREYFERRGDFEGLVDLLGDAVGNLPPEGSPGAVAVRLARARVLAGRLLRPSEAEIEIRRALQGDSRSIEARLELAGLHLWGDNLGEATTEYMRVLDQDPFNQDAYRGIFRVNERRGDLDRAAGAAQAVCAVGEGDDAERKMAAQAEMAMEPALPSAAATPLGIHGFWHLVASPAEPQAPRELLLAVADFLPQTFPADLERVSETGVMPLDPEEALATRCTLLGQVLGVDRFQTCLGQGRSEVVEVLPGSPCRLVVDERFAARASPAELRFAVGRGLAEILTRTAYFRVLSPRKVELLLTAVADLYVRGFAESQGAPDGIEEVLRTLGRVLPRRVRKTLEEPARAYAAAPLTSASAWVTQAQRSAERAGLLLAGDVRAALQRLVAEQAKPAVRAELLRFSVSPHLYEARRRLGLAI